MRSLYLVRLLMSNRSGLIGMLLILLAAVVFHLPDESVRTMNVGWGSPFLDVPSPGEGGGEEEGEGDRLADSLALLGGGEVSLGEGKDFEEVQLRERVRFRLSLLSSESELPSVWLRGCLIN